jgi:SET domain
VGRFINHSCEPNCIIEIWSSGGCLKVVGGISYHIYVFLSLSLGSSSPSPTYSFSHSRRSSLIVLSFPLIDRCQVGIFTSASIEAGGELTFDYQWPPNDRPPTICHCGTPSCRGTLEVYPKRSSSSSSSGQGKGQGQHYSNYHSNMPMSPAMARRRYSRTAQTDRQTASTALCHISQ